MAYVATSRQFMEDVNNTIRQMQQQEINTLGQQPSVTIAGLEDKVTASIWGEYLHLKAVIPYSWTGSCESVNLKVIDGFGVEQESHTTIYVSLPKALRTPPNWQRSRAAIDVAPDETPELVVWTEDQNKRKEVNERWIKARNSVLGYLANCKSVNEALKTYPDLRHYIPQHYINRVNEVVERKKKEPSAAIAALEAIDTDSLLANVVISRLAQSAPQETP